MEPATVGVQRIVEMWNDPWLQQAWNDLMSRAPARLRGGLERVLTACAVRPWTARDLSRTWQIEQDAAVRRIEGSLRYLADQSWLMEQDGRFQVHWAYLASVGR